MPSPITAEAPHRQHSGDAVAEGARVLRFKSEAESLAGNMATHNLTSSKFTFLAIGALESLA